LCQKSILYSVAQNGKQLCIECLYEDDQYFGCSCTQEGGCIKATTQVADKHGLEIKYEYLGDAALSDAQTNPRGAAASSSSTPSQEPLREQCDKTLTAKIEQLQRDVDGLNRTIQHLQEQIKYMSKHLLWQPQKNVCTDSW